MTERIGYRVGEVAEMLGMAQSTVSDFIRRGLIPVVRLGPKTDVRVPRWWVDQWKEAPKPLRAKDHP